MIAHVAGDGINIMIHCMHVFSYTLRGPDNDLEKSLDYRSKLIGSLDNHQNLVCEEDIH